MVQRAAGLVSGSAQHQTQLSAAAAEILASLTQDGLQAISAGAQPGVVEVTPIFPFCRFHDFHI